MKYKTLKGICTYFAKCNQQDKLHKTGVYIWRESDFSDSDNREITDNAAALMNFCKSFYTMEYNDFLNGCCNILPHYFFGFLAQNELIKTIKFNLKS